MEFSTDELGDLFDFFEENGTLLLRWWDGRRWEIAKAIERYAWDLESATRLLELLDYDVSEFPAGTEIEEIRNARRSLNLLDRLLSRESATPTGLLELPMLVRSILAEWLRLEVRFPLDERSPCALLRDQLVQEADRREIDLRGTGI